jgi:hypothetical protein
MPAAIIMVMLLPAMNPTANRVINVVWVKRCAPRSNVAEVIAASLYTSNLINSLTKV